MKKAFITSIVLIMSLVFSLVGKAQVVISGTVVSKGKNEAISNVNLLFQSKEGGKTYGFATTDTDGKYRFECSVDTDSLLVTIAGFNIKKHSHIIPATTDIVDFAANYEPLRLKEIVYKAEPVKRKADTLTYYVNAYADSLVDRTIGDVLKKMPGIGVAANGKITYNNRPVNKFYMEGLDMMGGRYGVAVNNVRSEDVAAVEVFENHQPIRSLQGFEYSPDAAINLRLKHKAKGSLIANIQAGLGYKPWLWDCGLAMMYFTSKWQAMTTYKTNNTGTDVTSELESFYDSFIKEYSELAVHTPSVPDTGRERYMDNSTHAVSVSTIFKLDEDSDRTLNMNAMYLHDKQQYNASSLTTYYLPDSEQLEIYETTAATECTDESEFKVKYNLNNEKIYLNEQIALGLKWDDDTGNVLNGSERTGQLFDMRQIRLQNDLRFIKVLGRVRMTFASRINASDLPSELTVTPVLYPELFGYESQKGVQEMSDRKFRTNNNLSVIIPVAKTGIDIQASVGFANDLQMMTSRLYSELSDDSIPDSLRNSILYRRYDARCKVAMNYRHRGFYLSLGISPTYSCLITDDYIVDSRRKKDRFFLNPYINANWKITPNLSVLVSCGLNGNIGSASSVYSGYIITDYRKICSKEGELAESLNQNYSGEIRYANALKSIFGSLKFNYWRRNSNLMFGTEYSGSLSRMQTYNIDNLSYGYEVAGKIEKRFNRISTTVSIPVGLRNSNMEVLRQGCVMHATTGSLSSGLTVSSRISANIFWNYNLGYVRTGSKLKESGKHLKPINALHQDLGFSFIFFKRLAMNVGGEHYFNDTIYDGSRNMVFLEASIKYKGKKLEYILEGRNLLNTGAYNHSSYSDISSYKYSYILRPVSVMFKLRFSLGV